MKAALIVCAILGFNLPLHAQTPAATPDKPELPSGPLLHPLDDLSKWEVTSTTPQPKPEKTKEAHKPKTSPVKKETILHKVITTKTGQIIHEEQFDASSQRTVDTWFDSGTQYRKFADDTIWYSSDRASAAHEATDTAYNPLPEVGYRDVELIKAENYVGTISHDERPCLVFVLGGFEKLDLKTKGDMQKHLDALETVAYVDAESRLPVEVRTPTEHRHFKFDPPPTERQTLPADLLTQIKSGDDGRAHLHQPAVRPY